MCVEKPNHHDGRSIAPLQLSVMGMGWPRDRSVALLVPRRWRAEIDTAPVDGCCWGGGSKSRTDYDSKGNTLVTRS